MNALESVTAAFSQKAEKSQVKIWQACICMAPP